MFRVQRAYYLPRRDLIVLTGTLVSGDLRPGMLVDFPRSMGGPGLVRIATVETVRFADGNEDLALTVDFHDLEPSPLFEPSRLEGRVIDVYAVV